MGYRIDAPQSLDPGSAFYLPAVALVEVRGLSACLFNACAGRSAQAKHLTRGATQVLLLLHNSTFPRQCATALRERKPQLTSAMLDRLVTDLVLYVLALTDVYTILSLSRVRLVGSKGSILICIRRLTNSSTR
jgi:hypothetical protein